MKFKRLSEVINCFRRNKVRKEVYSIEDLKEDVLKSVKKFNNFSSFNISHLSVSSFFHEEPSVSVDLRSK